MVQIYKRHGGEEVFWLTRLEVSGIEVMYDQIRIQVGARTNSKQELYVYHILSQDAFYASGDSVLEVLVQNLAHSLGNKEAYLEIMKAIKAVGIDGHNIYKFEGWDVYTVPGMGAPINKLSQSIGPDHRIKDLPGIMEIVKHPIEGIETTLSRVIQSLNDKHNWTRHQIADWVETLDVDIEFKSPEEMEVKRKAREEKEAADAKDMLVYWDEVTKQGKVDYPAYLKDHLQNAFPSAPVKKNNHSDHVHVSFDGTHLDNATYFQKYWYHYDKLSKK